MELNSIIFECPITTKNNRGMILSGINIPSNICIGICSQLPHLLFDVKDYLFCSDFPGMINGKPIKINISSIETYLHKERQELVLRFNIDIKTQGVNITDVINYADEKITFEEVIGIYIPYVFSEVLDNQIELELNNEPVIVYI